MVLLVPRIGILILALRNPGACLVPDSTSYLQLGHNLWTVHQFSSSPQAPYTPEAIRLPVYPLIVGIFTTVFGLPYPAVAVFQFFLGLITALLAWRWLRKMGSHDGALLCALILGCDWVVLFHTPLLIAETLLTLILLLAIQASWAAMNSYRLREVSLAGLLWGLSSITKPVGILLPMAISPLFFKKKGCVLLFLFTSYLPPALWMARNHHALGYAALTSQAGFDLLTHPASAIEAYRTGTDWGKTRELLTEQIDRDHPGGYHNDFEKSRVYQEAALKIFKEHPILFARLCFAGALKMLAGTGLEMLPQMLPSYHAERTKFSIHAYGQGTIGLLHRYPALIPIQILYMCALGLSYLLFFAGLARLWQQDLKIQAVFLGLGALYFLAVASHQGYYRFRIPMMPFLAIGAAAAFGGLTPRMTRKGYVP